MVRFHPENIAFTASAQSLFDLADAVHSVRCYPGEWHISSQRARYHLGSQRWLGGEGYSFRNVGRGKPYWIASPGLGQI